MTAAAPAPRVDAGLALLRIVVGIVFVAHGAQKLFTFGMHNVAGMFGQMGIPMAGVAGPLVALVEFFGGMALIVGLLARLAAVGLAVDMLGAIAFVHIAGGFFLPKGFEFALTLLAAALAIVLAGPGAYSVDAMIARRRSRL